MASRGDRRPEARLSGYWTQRVGRGSVPGVVEGGCLRSDARAAAPRTVCAPSEGMHPIGSVQPVWGHSTRERRFHLIKSIAPDQNGLNDHRWGARPHRRQASSRSWLPVMALIIVGDARSASIGACPTRACSWAPLATPDRHPTGHSRAVLHQRGSMTPGVLAGVLHHSKHPVGVSPVCRASIGAIPPVWWRPRRGASSTAGLSWCNSSVCWR